MRAVGLRGGQAPPLEERHDKQRGHRQGQQDSEQRDHADIGARQRAASDLQCEHEKRKRQEQHDPGHEPGIIDAEPDRADDMNDAVDQGQPDPPRPTQRSGSGNATASPTGNQT